MSVDFWHWKSELSIQNKSIIIVDTLLHDLMTWVLVRTLNYEQAHLKKFQTVKTHAKTYKPNSLSSLL